ncbi:MAG: hypothetical protein QOG91_259 [Candidatus Parcubacteria bacterium]|nr:hypothetical protein [Candidatus Parcubacteria bacterium]
MGSLTQTQRSIIIGSVLGDGYLRIVPKRKNAFLEINHTFHQKEYVDWKYSMLEPICRSGPVVRKGNGCRVAYRFTTRQSEEISEIYRRFYRDRRKFIPDDLILDPLMLAVWYMDDGSICGKSIYLNTQQFDSEDQRKCILLLKMLNIESTLNRDKIYWRIRIRTASASGFFNLISPYVTPSMQYKLSYSPVETRWIKPSELPIKAANTPTPL